MDEDFPLPRVDDVISRRSLLRSGAAAAALAALFPSDSALAVASETARSTAATTVRVCHDRDPVHVQPSLAANPRNPQNLLAACMAGSANPQFIATYLSFDGGASWQNGGVPPRPPGTNGDDVTVAFDAQGRGYVCATTNVAGRGIHVWRTDDGGRHFSAPVSLIEGQTELDAPWIAAGAPSGRNVYAVWSAGPGQAGILFTRSTDAGESFETPRFILRGPAGVVSAGGRIVAGPHGLVGVVSTTNSHFNAAGDVDCDVVAVCSTDAGESFSAPVRLGSSSSSILLPGNAKPEGFPTIAAGPQRDGLYVAFTTHTPSTTDSTIAVTASHDGGRTWSKAVTATPADGVLYFQPNLAVDPAGRVAISAFALANGLVSEVLLLSEPNNLHFRPPLRVSTAFDPRSAAAAGRKYGAWWIGVWQGITTSAEGIHLVWNETRTGKLELLAATVRP